MNVAALRGRCKVLAVKECHELAPWADVVYGCDASFWRNCQGLPKFPGLRVSYSGRHDGVRLIQIDVKADRLLMTPPGVIGSGGNSGFQALNLAVQWGARRIVLLGYDMSDVYGQHWYGPSNGQGRTNPGEWNFKRWRKAFAVAAEQRHALGLQIINASPLTSLDCFPVTKTVEEALERLAV